MEDISLQVSKADFSILAVAADLRVGVGRL